MTMTSIICLFREKEELESSDESEDEIEAEVTPGVKTKHDLMLKSEVSICAF